MIHGRINITTIPEPEPHGITEFEAVEFRDAHNAAVMAEILTGARAIAAEQGLTVVRVEVAYPGEDWEISGDALEIDLKGDEPQISTLPPYAEVTP